MATPTKKQNTPFPFEVNQFRTLNAKDSPVSLKDDELSILLNFMPIGTSLKTVPGYSAILASSDEGTTILRTFNAMVSGVTGTLIVTTDGALYYCDSDWTITKIKTAGTFTNPQFRQWKNTDVLIIDASGYYSFSPSNGTVANPGLTVGTNGRTARFTIDIAYTLSGIPYTKTATDNFWDLTGFNCSLSKKNNCYLYIDVAGNASIAPWTEASTTPLAPAIDATKCLVGTLVMNQMTGPHPRAFTGGTTAFALIVGQYSFTANIGGTSPGVTKHTASNAPASGTALDIWQGRVWVANGRTIYYSAPDSYSDFTTANSGGSVSDTESDLYATVTALTHTDDYLYVIGDHSTHLISGVQVFSTGNTVFNFTDALPGIGSIYPDTVISYGGFIYLMGDAGMHVLSGTSFQTFSSLLDKLYPKFVASFNPVASVLKVHNKNCYSVLVSLTSPVTGSLENWILCYYEGRWFVILYPFNLVAIMQRPTATSTLAYAAYGNNIIQILVGSSSMQHKLRTKAFNLNAPAHDKQVLKVGATVNSDAAIAVPLSAVISVYGGIIDAETGEFTPTVDTATVSLDLRNVTSSEEDVTGLASVEGGARGKRLRFDYDETSDASYELSGLLIEAIIGADF